MSSSSPPNPAIALYGWTAVPRAAGLLLARAESDNAPAPALSVDDIVIPDSQLAKEVYAYAKRELGIETFHHSMRVYCFGMFVFLLSYPLFLSSSQFPIFECFFTIHTTM